MGGAVIKTGQTWSQSLLRARCCCGGELDHVVTKDMTVRAQYNIESGG
jgi:hypothetical protein